MTVGGELNSAESAATATASPRRLNSYVLSDEAEVDDDDDYEASEPSEFECASTTTTTTRQRMSEAHNLKLVSDIELASIKVFSSTPMSFATELLVKLFKPSELIGHNISGSKNKKTLDERRINYIRWLVENQYGSLLEKSTTATAFDNNITSPLTSSAFEFVGQTKERKREELWAACRRAIHNRIVASNLQPRRILKGKGHYVCTVCGKPYRYAKGLKAHAKLQHPPLQAVVTEKKDDEDDLSVPQQDQLVQVHSGSGNSFLASLTHSITKIAKNFFDCPICVIARSQRGSIGKKKKEPPAAKSSTNHARSSLRAEEQRAHAHVEDDDYADEDDDSEDDDYADEDDDGEDVDDHTATVAGASTSGKTTVADGSVDKDGGDDAHATKTSSSKAKPRAGRTRTNEWKNIIHSGIVFAGSMVDAATIVAYAAAKVAKDAFKFKAGLELLAELQEPE